MRPRCISESLCRADIVDRGRSGTAQRTPDPQRQAALALEQAGKDSEAEAAWRAYLKAHPTNPEPYAHLGLLEARQEHYKEAVPALSQGAARSDPDVPGLRLNLGLALFKGGECKEPSTSFEPLLKTPSHRKSASRPPSSAWRTTGWPSMPAAVPFLQRGRGP